MDASVKPIRDRPDERDATVRLLALVEETVAELHPGQPSVAAALDSTLDKDLGLDSLSRVELLSRVERRFGVALPERLIAEAETPRDLLRVILSGESGLGPAAAAGAGEAFMFMPYRAEPAPQSARTLPEVLDWHVRHHPDHPHIRLYRDEGDAETLTYAALREGAARVAAGLQDLGLAAGQPVAIMLPTGAGYFRCFAGVLLAGGIPVPIYPPARLAQLEDHLKRHTAILDNCGAPILITVPEGKRLARLMSARVESLRHVVSPEDLAGQGGTPLTPPIRADDIALLQYTSGSTGTPKGVVLTHANLLANIRAMGRAIDVRPDDVFVSWLPLYHDMGLIGAWLGSLYFALPLVVMPPLSFLARPERWLWAMHRYRGTLAASPNFGYELCLRKIRDADIEGLDLSSWRLAFNGAEAVSPETCERFSARFAAHGLDPGAMAPVFGLAECSVGLAFPPPGRIVPIDRIRRDALARDRQAIPAEDADPAPLRFVSCGLPLPSHQIRVVDEAGRELPERREGHLQFRGPSATSGYFRNSEATRALFHDGWLDSGDLAYIAGGELYVTGRVKDIVIRAGRNIHPAEIEQAVSDIDGVRKGCVAVFGSRDPAGGTERLIVLAETRADQPAERDALRVRVNEAVTELIGAPPDDVALAPSGTVLKTSSGKIRRAANRDLYEQGGIGRRQGPLFWRMLRLAAANSAHLVRYLWRRGRDWLFAAWAWTVFGMLAPVVLGSVLSLPSFAARWRVMRGAIRLLRRATGTPLRIDGLEHLPPEGTPFVLVANHASYLDAYALIAAVPRHLRFVAKAELERDPLLGKALQRIGCEFVERFETERSVGDTRRLAQVLREGKNLMFFPEGTFTRVPGLMPFHLGAFVTAAEVGVPVVPVALKGTRSIFRSGSGFPHRGAIVITVGPPIDPATVRAEAGGDAWKTALRLRDAARAHLLSHCGEPDLGREPPESH
jgi:1-acyl-sn-glycerol-3-phosphate acyltransferase